jgi:hypothetical protein
MYVERGTTLFISFGFRIAINPLVEDALTTVLVL